MKFALASLATVAFAAKDHSSHFRFMQYIAEHSKSYADAAEYQLRFNLWSKADDFIVSHNADSTQTHTVGHNFMSDMTKVERDSRLGLANAHQHGKRHHTVASFPKANATTVDWRDEGAVNAVKDQGACGSCWSFSAIAALEGAYFLAGNDLLSFSEQQLVECAGINYGNMACYGGWYYQAWDYLKTHKSELEADYPYVSGTTGLWSQCSDDEHTGYTNVASYSALESTSEALMDALNDRPVSIAIEADTMTFQQYTTGVITSSLCGTTLDHAVTAVGYGTDADSGVEYFLVRNSWGEVWGEEGYVKIAVTDGLGTCGINQNNYVVYV
jgi:C1A family cysteine protease